MNKFKIVRNIKLVVSSVRLIPHLLFFFFSKNKDIISYEVCLWITSKKRKIKSNAIGFIYLMTIHPEFRNLFYHRIGFGACFISFLCRPLNSLYLECPNIGKGFIIWHGFSTIIHAKSIGENCSIFQQITVGNGKDGNNPTIGDNVQIYVGAKVLGGITVGNNSKIGACALVMKNVPANCTVVGVPAYIVKKNGVKTKEFL
jgi:serine O-acetyltransferase